MNVQWEKALSKSASEPSDLVEVFATKFICRWKYNIYKTYFVQSSLYCPTHWGTKEDLVLPTVINSPGSWVYETLSLPSANKIIYESVQFSNREQREKKLPQGKQTASFLVGSVILWTWNIHIRDLTFQEEWVIYQSYNKHFIYY